MVYLIVKLDCSSQSIHFINKKDIKVEFLGNNLYILIKKNDFLPSNDLTYEIMAELSELDIKLLQSQENLQKKILELLIEENIITSGMIRTGKFFHPGTIIRHKQGILTQILTSDPGVSLKYKPINPTEFYLNDFLGPKQFVGPLVNIKNYIPQILPHEQSLQYSFIALKKLFNLNKITEVDYTESKKPKFFIKNNFFKEIEFFNKYHDKRIKNCREEILDFREKLFKNSDFDDFPLFSNILNNAIQDEVVKGMGYVDLSNSNDLNSKIYAIRSFNSQPLWAEISKSLLNGTSQKSGMLLKILL